MENNYPRSIKEEGVDWNMLSQNRRSEYYVPSSSTVDGGGIIQDQYQQPPPLNSFMGSSSIRSVNGNNGGFLADTYGVFPPFMKQQQQQQLPTMGSHLGGVNPIRSIADHRIDRYATMSPNFDAYGYSCNSCNTDQLYNYGVNDPGVLGFVHQSPNMFQETPIDRNLDFDFSRLNISSPSHYPGTTIRNNPLIDYSYNTGNMHSHRRGPINRTNGCNDMCCNPHNSLRDGSEVNIPRGFNNGFDQNPNWVRDYSNPSPPGQNRMQPKRMFSDFWKDMRGKIYSVAKNQEGCQFLQMKCEEGSPEDIDIIFNEIKDHMRELMVDPSMNYLAQKLFKVCNERQMTHIVLSATIDNGSLTNICLNSHGTRAMQKLIELVTTAEQRSLIVSALRRITVTLTKNMNGHHVIQHCLKCFHVDEVQPILNVVADHCLEIATDKSGCCVLQQCVLHANGASKERLMTEIIDNALHLSEHPYGNYVVQHILGMQMPDVTANVLQKLAGNFVTLAQNKYASNVIEKCLKDAPEDLSTPIIREIINSTSFLGLIQNPFGNYVAQSALHTAKGTLREMMVNRIQKEYAYLHSHPHGKRVLALARISKPRGLPHA